MQVSEFPTKPPQPKSGTEVLEITRGLRDVPIERIESGLILREYDFNEMIHCGRKSCQQLHGWGYLVGLRGGDIVNIGHDCAAKYANAEKWHGAVSAFERDKDRSARDQAIIEARESAQAKQFWLDSTPEIAEAIELHASFRTQAGPRLLDEVCRRAEKGKPTIERERRLSEQEREVRRMALLGARRHDEPAPQVPLFDVERLGDLKGLYCFRPGREPGELRARLQRLVNTLLGWIPAEDDLEGTKALQKCTRNELGPISNDVQLSLVATRDFFSDANLRMLMNLPLMASQGVLAIERVGSAKVVFHRRSGWGKSAA